MRRAVGLAGVLLAGVLVSAHAQDVGAPHAASPAAQPEREMTLPRVTPVAVDWDAVRRDAAKLSVATSDMADDAKLTQLNEATERVFASVNASAVPVLLPLNVAALLKDPAMADTAGFRPNFFFAGPTGYDAAFTLLPEASAGIAGFERKEDTLIFLSASSVLYELDAPVGETARPSKELESLIPGIRRRWLESYLRYSFERYGVTYTVAMRCFDGQARRRWVSCGDAAEVIVRFIKALQLAGGTPQPAPEAVNTIDRPVETSADFTFHPPGKLLPNTGFRGHGGRTDTTVYARIRFPLAEAPSYANSQAFLNWGNCDLTGRTRHNATKGAPYRCRLNNKPLVFDESARENRSYPWRDNFCEHRRYFVGQCGGGEGHQGQDIRPASCNMRNAQADRCIAYRDDVVAVRDGMVLRLAGRESVYLYVNAPGERLRFRYLHMHPKMLDADGVLSGRVVREGEVLGKAGNYDRIPNGTTYHVHFELQVPTRDGWVFVNPYMTLVASYERLIGGHGRQIEDAEPTPAEGVAQASAEGVTPPPENADTAAVPLPPPRIVRPSAHEERQTADAIKAGNESPKQSASKRASKPRKDTARVKPSNAKATAAARACKASVSSRSGKRDCAFDRSRSRTGAKSGVRKMGRALPPARTGARRVGSNVQARDDRPQAGHVSLRTAQ